MSLFKNYFDAEDISNISYSDVVSFFQHPRNESDKIEFKSSGKDISSNILKSICGFLNSEGGLLIWGAPVGKPVEGKKEKEFSGELTAIESLYEKDAFISKVTDSITPAPRGILFHGIEHNGSYVYLIDIPKSEYSPHQFQNTYYMRIDGQTKPAPHHYIEALMKKVSYPNLLGYLKIEQCEMNGRNLVVVFGIYIFNLSKLQNEYNLSVRLIGTLGKLQGQHITFHKGWEQQYLNTKEVLYYGEPFHGTCVIEMDVYELQQQNYTMEVHMFFGAKLSPMKTCDYNFKIDFNSIPKDLNACILSKNENQYMYEVKEKLGISDEQSIEKHLGRKIH